MRSLGTFAERYVPGGYVDKLSFEEQLEIISKVDGIKGLVVWYPEHLLIDDPDKLARTLKNYNLV